VSGRDLVTWLLAHVEGLPSRRAAKTYAAGLLKAGYIQHTVHKASFSEKCYYTFADIVKGETGLTLFFTSCICANVATMQLVNRTVRRIFLYNN